MKTRIKKFASLAVIIAIIAVTGYFISQVYTAKNPLNVFEGKITGAKVSLGRVEGVTTYDANCVGQQVVQCDAGISTNEYGVLNFHYQHSMSVQPCLHMFGPEKVTLDILNLDGDAKITRTIDTSAMGGHHS